MKLARSLWATLPKYMSLRHAPSFRQSKPCEVIGVATRLIPPECVPAFVVSEVIDDVEEQALLTFTAPWFSRLAYNDGHMDSLIHHFRECYRPYREIVGNAAGDANHSGCDVLDEGVMTLARNALRRCRKIVSEYLVSITPG
ncbi:alkylated DNA repair protein alkB like protein 7 [Trypanosoma rangeli]|uniref:Alkylated DNA repair protein alkB like protein 7 n=1 Tax=Trypanosoma rangeli TaxID=5698 RepID=A0A422MYP7_TRYRA|nr:alkylated DNA repair protein alkB like protein 7 [Trypanosoma rangeli]RNE98333.1 alkylated DNA repair protein alkB like protein 7 [Trypanosoma rangeli]|eukprot:RNE98333.1 alkylated DNA repair protein alkB like protein 7 [Trypanosoma rangeli]